MITRDLLYRHRTSRQGPIFKPAQCRAFLEEAHRTPTATEREFVRKLTDNQLEMTRRAARRLMPHTAGCFKLGRRLRVIRLVDHEAEVRASAGRRAFETLMSPECLS